MSYDVIERYRQAESQAVISRLGGDLRKYYRFFHGPQSGGMITADCAGSGLVCKFCWAQSAAAEPGREEENFFSPVQAADRLLQLMKEHDIRQARISGGEPLIGRDHLLKLLALLQNKRVRLILETDGILLGVDETYAQELSLFPFVHVRLSLKGCTEKEFGLLTGAARQGYQLQLAGLRNLVKAGVSTHPAVIVSSSEGEGLDRLYGMIWKLNPRLHSEVELEEFIPAPPVELKPRTLGPYAEMKPQPPREQDRGYHVIQIRKEAGGAGRKGPSLTDRRAGGRDGKREGIVPRFPKSPIPSFSDKWGERPPRMEAKPQSSRVKEAGDRKIQSGKESRKVDPQAPPVSGRRIRVRDVDRGGQVPRSPKSSVPGSSNQRVGREKDEKEKGWRK